MSDWELHDFAISVVKNRLLEEGKNVYSTCSDMEINPSLWFEGNDLHYWVVIRGFRHPMVSAERPDDLQLEHEIQELSNSLGIAGKISLKEKLTFDVVWQRKLPEMFYPLRFHTKKIRIFD